MDNPNNIPSFVLVLVFIVLLVGNIIVWFNPNLFIAFLNIGKVDGKDYKGLQKYGFAFINHPSYKWFVRIIFSLAFLTYLYFLGVAIG